MNCKIRLDIKVGRGQNFQSMTKDKTGRNKEYKELTVEVTQDQVCKHEDGSFRNNNFKHGEKDKNVKDCEMEDKSFRKKTDEDSETKRIGAEIEDKDRYDKMNKSFVDQDNEFEGKNGASKNEAGKTSKRIEVGKLRFTIKIKAGKESPMEDDGKASKIVEKLEVKIRQSLRSVVGGVALKRL